MFAGFSILPAAVVCGGPTGGGEVNRRGFLVSAAAATVWPIAAWAQEVGRTYRLGFLTPVAREAPAITAFLDELRLAGFNEGENLILIADGFDVRNDQISERAGSVVIAVPDAIVSRPLLHTRALQRLTQAIPLVAMTEDMVAEKLVASLARPGGNITGISLLSPELDGKRQDILIEAVPRARRIAALADANVTPIRHLQTLQDAARTRDVTLLPMSVGAREEIPAALHSCKASGAEALNVLASPLFFVNRRTVIDHAAALRLPAIYQWPNMAEEGGFLAYGPRFEQVYRQRARLVVKLLRGAKDAEIPVEQPSVFELALNLQTAKSIDYQVPEALIHRADKVIE